MFCIRLEDDHGFLSYFNGYKSLLKISAKYKTDQMVLFDDRQEAQQERDQLQKEETGLLLVLPVKIG